MEDNNDFLGDSLWSQEDMLLSSGDPLWSSGDNIFLSPVVINATLENENRNAQQPGPTSGAVGNAQFEGQQQMRQVRFFLCVFLLSLPPHSSLGQSNWNPLLLPVMRMW